MTIIHGVSGSPGSAAATARLSPSISFAMLVCLLLPVAAAAEDPAALTPAHPPGLVIAYGTPLVPPLIFRVEGDVLTVNGFPLFPGAIAPEKPREPRAVDPALREWATGFLSELDRIQEEAHAAMAQATTRKAAVDSAVSVYSRSSLVTSVKRIGQSQLWVDFSGGPGPMNISLGAELVRFGEEFAPPAPPSPEKMAQLRATKRRLLEESVSYGCLYAFGYDCVLALPSGSGIAMRQLLGGSSAADSAAVATALRHERLMEDIRIPPALTDLRQSLHLPPAPPIAADE